MLKNHHLKKRSSLNTSSLSISSLSISLSISSLSLGLLIACQEDIPSNTSQPTVVQGDFRVGDFASLRIEDMRPNYDFYLLDIQATTTPDMQIISPDMQTATPDMQVVDMDIHDQHDHGPMDASLGENIDLNNFNVTCADPTTYRNALAMCSAGTSRTTAIVGFNHIADQTPISYAQNPPSSGDHRNMWAKYGEYTRLPPQRWLHNLEHGAIVFLYHPCAPTEQIDQLRQIARAQANDSDTNAPFRWILTPYPELASSIAVVAWGVDYQDNCVNPQEIQDFITANYRRGREDVSSDGTYQTEWIGR
jgi:hypothetical protein